MCFDFRDVPSAGFLCFFAACRKGASAVCRDILEAVLELHLRSSIAFVKHKNVGRQILCLIGGKLCRNEAENQLDRGVLPKGHSPSFQGCLLDIWKTPFFPPVFYSRSWFQASLRAISLQVSPALDPKFLPILTCACATLLKSPSVHTLIKNKQIKKAKRQSLLQIKLWWGRFPSPHHSTKRQQLLWETNTTVSIFWQYLRCVGRELI